MSTLRADTMILQVLQSKSMDPFGVKMAIRGASGGRLNVNNQGIVRSLSGLEKRGLVVESRGVYYATRKGKDLADQDLAIFKGLVSS